MNSRSFKFDILSRYQHLPCLLVKMKLLKSTFTLLALASLTSATALPKPDVETTSLTAREVPNGAYCLVDDVEWVTAFEITTWGAWDDDWGQTFLTNINNQCWVDHGYAQNWQFYYEEGPPPTNGHASFVFTGGWTWGADCVQNAIWLASESTGAIGGVECQIGTGF
jgi:hypothetical protein